MNFSDEEYVRLYVADTVTWKCLEWQGQALLALALRKFDRSGLLEFGRHGAEKALMVATGMPMEVIEAGLTRLLEEEVWVLRDGCIFWPKYIEAQTCTRSDRVRQRTSRARRASERDESSKFVTTRHESESKVTDVTEGHTRPGEGMARRGSDPEEGAGGNQPTKPEPAYPNPPCGVRMDRSFAMADPAAVALFDAWKAASGKNGAQYDWKRRELFERILSEGVTVEQVRLVVAGAKTDHWASETQKLAPASILGSAEQREKYMALAKSPPKPKPGARDPGSSDSRPERPISSDILAEACRL